MCHSLYTKREIMIMPISKKRVAFALSIALSGSAAGETSQDSGHDMHSGPIMNYHRIDERLVTGGHLVGNGVETLKAEGVTVVIDLRDKPPSEEQQHYAEHGIEWINVPVVWKNPQPADFARFSEVMQAHEGKHVLVQCAANYRASAFTYLYRVVVGNVDEETAAADLHAVWVPEEENERWSQYITNVKGSKN